MLFGHLRSPPLVEAIVHFHDFHDFDLYFLVSVGVWSNPRCGWFPASTPPSFFQSPRGLGSFACAFLALVGLMTRRCGFRQARNFDVVRSKPFSFFGDREGQELFVLVHGSHLIHTHTTIRPLGHLAGLPSATIRDRTRQDTQTGWSMGIYSSRTFFGPALRDDSNQLLEHSPTTQSHGCEASHHYRVLSSEAVDEENSDSGDREPHVHFWHAATTDRRQKIRNETPPD